MVDADAVVLLPGARLIVPERIKARTPRAGADRIGKAEIGERAEFLPRARQEQGVADPALGIAGIELGRNHIVVARENQRLLQFKPFKRIMQEAVPSS